MAKYVRETSASLVGVWVHYTCSGQPTVWTAKPSLEVEGGCNGDHGDNDYCYCPSTEITAEILCVACGTRHRFDLKYL